MTYNIIIIIIIIRHNFHGHISNHRMRDTECAQKKNIRPARLLVYCCTMGADGRWKFLHWTRAGDLDVGPSEKKAAAGLSVA